MIKSIKTQNFETWLDMEIELHPGVNTFVGESDEGKSGIIRQIKWNAKNRPQGDSYRNDQLDPKKKKDKLKATVVGIDYKDSAFIVRARDGFAGGVNHYQIDDGEPLRALRTDVPDEVQELTRMKDVNIQGQHPTEQYFLLADKPGQVAKEFNKVAGLTVMDKATADINSQVRTCNTKIKIVKEEIKTKQEELEDTKWVDKAEKLAHKLNAFKKLQESEEVKYRKLLDIINHLDEIDEVLARYYDGLDEALKELDILKKEKEAIDQKNNDIILISNLIADMNKTDLKLKEYTDINKALKALKTLNSLNEKKIKTMEKFHNISVLLKKFKLWEESMQEAEEDLKKIQKEYYTIREEQECPTCGRKGK
jgi:exonuclease SbcC